MNRVEAIARAICLARNQDPDTYPAEHHSGLLVGADGRPGPWPEKPWMLRQQEAREFAMCFDAAMEQKKHDPRIGVHGPAGPYPWWDETK